MSQWTGWAQTEKQSQSRKEAEGDFTGIQIRILGHIMNEQGELEGYTIVPTDTANFLPSSSEVYKEKFNGHDMGLYPRNGRSYSKEDFTTMLSAITEAGVSAEIKPDPSYHARLIRNEEGLVAVVSWTDVDTEIREIRQGQCPGYSVKLNDTLEVRATNSKHYCKLYRDPYPPLSRLNLPEDTELVNNKVRGINNEVLRAYQVNPLDRANVEIVCYRDKDGLQPWIVAPLQEEGTSSYKEQLDALNESNNKIVVPIKEFLANPDQAVQKGIGPLIVQAKFASLMSVHPKFAISHIVISLLCRWRGRHSLQAIYPKECNILHRLYRSVQFSSALPFLPFPQYASWNIKYAFEHSHIHTGSWTGPWRITVLRCR